MMEDQYKFRSSLRQPLRNRFGELSKVVQMMPADLIDDGPVYGLIAVDGDVSESYSFGHAFSENRVYDLKFLKNLQVLRHCGGRNRISFGNQMCGNIDGKLDGALKIERNDVLQVEILNEFIH